jgi:hypothetical protein
MLARYNYSGHSHWGTERDSSVAASEPWMVTVYQLFIKMCMRNLPFGKLGFHRAHGIAFFHLELVREKSVVGLQLKDVGLQLEDVGLQLGDLLAELELQ